MLYLFRLSCVLHVLLNTLEHFLSENVDYDDIKDDDILPLQISVEVVEIAQKLVRYFSEQREIFLMVRQLISFP